MMVDYELIKSYLIALAILIPGYLFATIGVGWLIGWMTKRLIRNENDKEFQKMIDSGLPNAGRYIGWLERMLIITFILVENYNGIGFILAAKGILRFGEIKRGADRKFAEYVILGTLMSFSISFIVGLLLKFLLEFFT
ncbi:MAG: hypothetical protein ACE5HS_20660 [bacterium]